jgi:hypothetical protein
MRKGSAVNFAMMKRAEGATLAEIMQATAWQARTVRGFVSILGEHGRAEDRILEERRRGAQLPHREVACPPVPPSQRRFRFRPGRRSCFV